MLSILAAALLVPPSLALGNHASVVVEADDSAAAACQVFVLVNSLVILRAEDSLALVAPRASAPLSSQLGALQAEEGGVASCSTVIGALRLVVPPALGLDGASFVSGASLAPGPHVEVVGENSDAAVCQAAFLFRSIVIGGGAYGFPTGESTGLVSLQNDWVEGGHATCEAAIARIDVEEAS